MELDTIYYDNGKSSSHSLTIKKGVKTETAKACKKMCEKTSECVQFAWFSNTFGEKIQKSAH